MLDDTPRPAHVQRCTYTELRGRRHWQCLLGDPHPSGKGHEFPIDARFGQELHTMHPEKLAALLRDQVALTDHAQRRVDEIQAIAMNLAEAVGLGGTLVLRPETWAWLLANDPATATKLGYHR